MTDADEVLAELDPQPAVEALPVSRRATLQALASVAALASVGSASAQDAAGGVIAEEAFFSNYGWEPDSDGGTLTIDGDEYTFDGSEEIELPDGSTATEMVLPGGENAREVIGPDDNVLWEPELGEAWQTPLVDGYDGLLDGDDDPDDTTDGDRDTYAVLDSGENGHIEYSVSEEYKQIRFDFADSIGAVDVTLEPSGTVLKEEWDVSSAAWYVITLEDELGGDEYKTDENYRIQVNDTTNKRVAETDADVET